MYIIPLLIIFGSAIGIFFILGKKFPDLSSIEPTEIKEDKEADVKSALIMNRMQRNVQEAINRLAVQSRPTINKTRKILNNFYLQTESKERSTRKQIEPRTVEEKISYEDKLKKSLDEAAKFLTEENYSEAEKRYIDILATDQMNRLAYRGLADIYIARKEYEQARETLKFLIKLNGNNLDKEEGRNRLAIHNVDLGTVLKSLDDHELSLKYFTAAVDLEPNNPRNLDLLTEASIAAKNSKLAFSTFHHLQEVDPENKKLDDLKKRIDSL